jgi:hypothetical protein
MGRTRAGRRDDVAPSRRRRGWSRPPGCRGGRARRPLPRRVPRSAKVLREGRARRLLRELDMTEKLLDLPADRVGHALRPERIALVQQILEREPQCVGHPVECLRADHRCPRDLQQADAESDEVPRKVPRVHGRDIAGAQWFERERVVPVVEVPVEPLEPHHRRQGAGHSVDEPAGGDIAEVVGGQVCDELEPHVRGRGAVGDLALGVLLEVVRREPVVPRGHEPLEEAPRPARGPALEQHVGKRGCRARTSRWAADAPREQW